MKALKFIILLIILTLFYTAIYSQNELIPLSNTKDIYVYTKNLDDSLHIFSDIKGFKKAKFFKKNDTTYFAFIYFQRDSQLYLIKKEISPTFITNLKAKINFLQTQNENINQSKFFKNGKLRFNLGSSFYSLAGYAWMVPVAADLDDEYWIGTYLISGAAGIIIPMWLTSKQNITPAQALYKNYGQFKGFGDGLIIYNFFDKDLYNFKLALISSMSFSILEGTAGYLIAKKQHFSYLNALTSRNLSLYGYYWGASLGAMWVKKYDFYACRIPALIANFAGAAGGYFLSKYTLFTRGDNRILLGTTLLANTWAVAINTSSYKNLGVLLDVYTTGISPLYFGAATLGIATGTYLGIKNNLTATQAVITDLSTFGSELITSGLVYIFSKTNDFNIIIKRSLWASSIVGTSTFAFFYTKYANANKVKNLLSSTNKYDISFSFNPYLLITKNHIITKDPQIYNPVFSLNIKF